MKTFIEWMKSEGVFPNLGQHAIPVNQNVQVNLSALADLADTGKVDDPNWYLLYDKFEEFHAKHPSDKGVQQFGTALYQAAQSNDMSSLQPYVQKYLKAQRI